MTMPHLMNCAHSEDGWCLRCVNELHEDCDALMSEVRDLKFKVNRYASRALIEFYVELDGDWVARLIGGPFPAYGKAATATEAFMALPGTEVMEGMR